ncbi:6-pyruvoyl-tetrahydropterin synthase-related protein [Limnoraphis robusta Tam1]|uniref:6-pyruvoyl-tetrahydropterin synthase-related protein n=1 Tax=Limnoraphis robusta TaxID=1118279 RepID=UPI002B1F52F8|nr:6-pyruvoyl-tetrahydropterin synthase-related protein [Limnoraphis robusta]MEA5538099.1 6-pyruvoyl-tetrahydropterin synthase-related protein [Limnoraphis robusta Tam1]
MSNYNQFSFLFKKNQGLNHPKIIEFGAILFLGLIALFLNSRMIRDGVNGLGDLFWHLTWVQHFSQQIAEGILYPRWIAGTNYGYGSPTFVFYPPLAYYIGSVFKLIGLDIEQTFSALFTLAIFLSGLNFYIFARSQWDKIPSLVGALAFMSAPPVARILSFGGLTTAFATALIPLGLYLTNQSITKPKWRIALVFFWATLALTHLPSLLLYTIIWFIYTLFLFPQHPWKSVLATQVSAGIGFGLVCFYLIPAILEQSLVNIDYMTDVKGGWYENMLGSSSLPIFPIGEIKDLNYAFVHQSVNILIGFSLLLIFCLSQAKIIRKALFWFAFIGVIGFLMSRLSAPIWAISSTLQKVQFPYRLIMIYSFGGAALFGLTANGLLQKRGWIKIFPLALLIVLLILNLKYTYRLSRSLPTTQNPGRGVIPNLEYLQTIINDPFTDKLTDVGEYRPLLPDGSSPPVPIINQPQVSVENGEAEVTIDDWGSYSRKFTVAAETPSLIRIRTYHYPAWHLSVNQEERPIDIAEDSTMQFELEPGSYQIELQYRQWTKALVLGTGLSVASAVAFIIFSLFNFKTKSPLN